jgi:glycosyltransferase involved in cell wall biosynthesis
LRVNMASATTQDEEAALPSNSLPLYSPHMTSEATSHAPISRKRARGGDTGSMHLAIEASRLAREVRGIGRYVRALLPRLLAQRPGLRITLFIKRMHEADGIRQLFDPATLDRVDIRSSTSMARSGADVFWYPWNTIGPTPRTGCVVVTMHDVVPIAHPDPRLRGTYKNLRWRIKFHAAAKRADLIITDSRFSADEIHRTLGVRHDHMRVVLLAADDFNPAPSTSDDATLEKLGVVKPYVLAVGAGDQRKNLVLLDRAMPRVHELVPDLSLVLAGPRRKSATGDEPWRNTLGFVSDAELATLFRGAHALIQPSVYEGFGLPVLEAMQLGTPVICAYASSLPEVGGDAAAWIDPHDDEALARVIVDVVSNPARREQMAIAGRAQAARFSWDKTARETLDAFDEARARNCSHARR